jgi:hypothetical protein
VRLECLPCAGVGWVTAEQATKIAARLVAGERARLDRVAANLERKP